MVKAKLSTDRGIIYFIGLSHMNLERLKAGDPILFKARELGMDIEGEIVIVAGETEATIKKELEEKAEKSHA